MESLNGDCLEKLLDILDAKSRLRFSLVCKSWQRLESECLSCPASLDLRSEDFGSTFIPWLVRDTSRLRDVKFLPGTWKFPKADASWGCINKLLEGLSCQASALRRLEFSFPACDARIQGPTINFKPFPFASLIPRIASLSRLERLALRKWEYTRQEVALIAHLSRLQNLEAVELSCIRFDGDPTKAGISRSEAALLLRQTISSLMRITSLEMDEVDFTDRCSEAMLLAKHVGSMTKLRSLAFGYHYGTFQTPGFAMEIQVPYPALRELVSLTRLSLCCDASLGVPEGLLTSLHSLKEVAINNGFGPQFPVLLAPSAVVTKLELTTTIDREDVQRLNSILPLSSLRHVKELALCCKSQIPAPLDLPGDWSRLTGLTKLSFHFRNSRNHGMGSGKFILQEFFTAVRGLRDLEVTGDYHTFDRQRQEYILLMADRLAGLTRLQMELVPVPRVSMTLLYVQPGSLASGGLAPHERVRQICLEVGHRVPGMGFAMKRVEYKLKYCKVVNLCLTVTLNR